MYYSTRVPVIDGQAFLQIPSLEDGMYYISAYYPSNEKYGSSGANYILRINQHATRGIMQETESYYYVGDMFRPIAVFDTEKDHVVGERVVFMLGGIVIGTVYTDENGAAICPKIPLDFNEGTYMLSAMLGEDKHRMGLCLTQEIHISRRKLEIKIDEISNCTRKDTIHIRGHLLCNEVGTADNVSITCSINNDVLTDTVTVSEDTSFEFDYIPRSDMKCGDHNVVVTCAGDTYYSPARCESQFILVEEPRIIMEDNVEINEVKTFTGQIVGLNGEGYHPPSGEVTVRIKYEQEKVDKEELLHAFVDTNGTFSFVYNVPPDSSITQTITVYLEESNYNTNSTHVINIKRRLGLFVKSSEIPKWITYSVEAVSIQLYMTNNTPLANTELQIYLVECVDDELENGPSLNEDGSFKNMTINLSNKIREIQDPRVARMYTGITNEEGRFLFWIYKQWIPHSGAWWFVFQTESGDENISNLSGYYIVGLANTLNLTDTSCNMVYNTETEKCHISFNCKYNWEYYGEGQPWCKCFYNHTLSIIDVNGDEHILGDNLLPEVNTDYEKSFSLEIDVDPHDFIVTPNDTSLYPGNCIFNYTINSYLDDISRQNGYYGTSYTSDITFPVDTIITNSDIDKENESTKKKHNVLVDGDSHSLMFYVNSLYNKLPVNQGNVRITRELIGSIGSTISVLSWNNIHDEYTYGEQVILSVTLLDEYAEPMNKQEIELYDGSTLLSTMVTDSNGRVSFAYIPKTSGVHTVSAKYNGNDCYTMSNISYSFTLRKLDVETYLTLNSIPVDPVVGEDIVLNIELDDKEHSLSGEYKVDVKLNDDIQSIVLKTDKD